MSQRVDVSKEEAIEAVRAASWKEGPTESETESMITDAIDALRADEPGAAFRALSSLRENRPQIIHTVGSICGADWSLQGAVDFIEKATRVAWVPHLFGHELAVQSDGRVIRFEVRAPDAVREIWKQPA